jgi:hypothetical protein
MKSRKITFHTRVSMGDFVSTEDRLKILYIGVVLRDQKL